MGLSEKEIRKRALELEAFGTRFRVMHPVDCLASRLENLRLLPEKRNEVGVAQAKVAAAVVRAFIADVISRGEARHALKLAEFIIRLATTPAGINARTAFNINAMDAVPVEKMPEDFRIAQWPQAKEYYEKKGAKAAASRNRVRRQKSRK